jgi:hypothetical protein
MRAQVVRVYPQLMASEVAILDAARLAGQGEDLTYWQLQACRTSCLCESLVLRSNSDTCFLHRSGGGHLMERRAYCASPFAGQCRRHAAGRKHQSPS